MRLEPIILNDRKEYTRPFLKAKKRPLSGNQLFDQIKTNISCCKVKSQHVQIRHIKNVLKCPLNVDFVEILEFPNSLILCIFLRTKFTPNLRESC